MSKGIINLNSHIPKLLTTLTKTLYLVMPKQALANLMVPLMIEKLKLLEVRLPAGTCIKWETSRLLHNNNSSSSSNKLPQLSLLTLQ